MLQPFLNRFIVRDFVYSEQEIAKQENDLQMANATEKELWVSWRILCTFSVLIRCLDRATKTGSHKFLRIIPDSSASQSHPTIRRECFAIRITSRIYWIRCGSKLVHRNFNK